MSSCSMPTGKGKLLSGPFITGDVKVKAPYSGDDFDGEVINAQREYFEIGEVDYVRDYIYWNIAAIDMTSDRFEVQQIELSSTPDEDNIFTRDGSLIVFENDLRPQYTTINLEAVTQ